MKVILESEMEKWAWEIMIAAHYKWEKNNGDTLIGQMDWYFFDIYKEKTEEMVKKEVEARLAVDYDPEGLNVIGVNEEQYIQKCLEDEDLTEQEREEVKETLATEYRDILADYADRKQYMAKDVSYDLKKIYYMFFCAPERLTVIYNGKVIQGGDAGQECEA